MSRDKIEDLRSHLFAALEGLADTENPMDIERALAIGKISETIVQSAKVEVQFISVTGGLGSGSGFIPESPRKSGLHYLKSSTSRG